MTDVSGPAGNPVGHGQDRGLQGRLRPLLNLFKITCMLWLCRCDPHKTLLTVNKIKTCDTWNQALLWARKFVLIGEWPPPPRRDKPPYLGRAKCTRATGMFSGRKQRDSLNDEERTTAHKALTTVCQEILTSRGHRRLSVARRSTENPDHHVWYAWGAASLGNNFRLESSSFRPEWGSNSAGTRQHRWLGKGKRGDRAAGSGHDHTFSLRAS